MTGEDDYGAEVEASFEMVKAKYGHLIDSAELDELREAIGRTVKMIRKIRELNLVDPTELQPLFRPYASDGPNE